MNGGRSTESARAIAVVMLVLGLALGLTGATYAGETSSEFAGHHVNSGTVTHEITAGKHVLTMSQGFPVPEAPDPTGRWWTRRATLEVVLGEASFARPLALRTSR